MPSNPYLESDTFCFRPMDWVLMGWTETEVRGLSDCLMNNPTALKPLQWGVALICWAFNAIWFCMRQHLFFAQTQRVASEVDVGEAHAPAPQAGSPRVRSTMWQILKIMYHGLPEPLEANTESESEEVAEPVAGPEASGTSLPSGGVSSSDEEDEQEVEQSTQVTVAEGGLVSEDNGAGVREIPRSPTPPGLDVGSSGSVTPLVGQKRIALASPIPPVTAGEDVREPPFKKAKGFTKTGWLLTLNQWLREGQMQPVMCVNMEAMQEDGVLLVHTSVLFFCVVRPSFQAVSTKCDGCKATSGRSCRIPADSDNGHPSCAECLISSHSCPSRLVPATQAACPATIHKAPTVRHQVVVMVPCIGDITQEYWRIEGSQMNPHPPIRGDFTTDFAFGLVERLSLQLHPHEATWDQIMAASGKIVAGYHALQYDDEPPGSVCTEFADFTALTIYQFLLYSTATTKANSGFNL
ncbi:hypothetical protein IW261DRAFT_1574912 [Armillaria novae-zelandiae]|uniref:Uncharacterized protein n=1 Tax=Armillaria novae-zelandiae TaxID=153914 RepID=A0AA39NHF3_9AGAR|nr:hypothetical protein IW261DRAFT_1574912 [Armillaria novae-zelandiae]